MYVILKWRIKLFINELIKLFYVTHNLFLVLLF